MLTNYRQISSSNLLHTAFDTAFFFLKRVAVSIFSLPLCVELTKSARNTIFKFPSHKHLIIVCFNELSNLTSKELLIMRHQVNQMKEQKGNHRIMKLGHYILLTGQTTKLGQIHKTKKTPHFYFFSLCYKKMIFNGITLVNHVTFFSETVSVILVVPPFFVKVSANKNSSAFKSFLVKHFRPSCLRPLKLINIYCSYTIGLNATIPMKYFRTNFKSFCIFACHN